MMAPQVFVDGLTSDLRKLGLGEEAEQGILDAFAPVLGESQKVPNLGGLGCPPSLTATPLVANPVVFRSQNAAPGVRPPRAHPSGAEATRSRTGIAEPKHSAFATRRPIYSTAQIPPLPFGIYTSPPLVHQGAREPFHEPKLPASRLVPLDVHGVLDLRDRVSREWVESELGARKFSYVIVGGGTAGLVLANRLSEDPENKVLVIEAGPLQSENPDIETPSMAGPLFGTEIDWNYRSIPQKGLYERKVVYPRGKLVGGTSNFNACVWSRGPAVDYDAWERLGNPGWNWADLLPYQRRSETFHIPVPAANLPAATAHDPLWVPSAHGHGGPVDVSYSQYISPQMQGFFESFRQEGLREIDPCGGAAAGVGYVAESIRADTETRSSSEASYLASVLGRENLLVITNAQATRIIWSSKRAPGRPVKARGVELCDAKNPSKKLVARVADEVILCGGTFNSPQLLELSGVGNAELLRQSGIEPVVDLPGVGENFQDHPCIAMSFRLKRQYESLDMFESDARLKEKIHQEFLHHEGPLAQTAPVVAFLPPGHYLDKPEYMHGLMLAHRVEGSEHEHLPIAWAHPSKKQLHVEQSLYGARGMIEVVAMNRFLGGVKKEEGRGYIGVIVALQHALSRGNVHITSSDPLGKPRIDPQMLSHPADAFQLAHASRHVHDMCIDPTSSLAKFLDLPKAGPGHLVPLHMDGAAHAMGEDAEEQAWEDWLRSNARTEHHPASTCSMLPRPDGGVVDPHLLVYGTSNVRVADLSIVPLHVATHPQTLAYMIGEKASEIIVDAQLRRRGC
ncbi:GMC family oxidoreductase [Rhodotorula paludigena]|uniref:GMC family oxidoreductase n=1 Tax=Rhodotorula paludigena TaxID=86838 RepID=UPI00317FC9C9